MLSASDYSMKLERMVGRKQRFSASVALIAILSGCGGGSGGSGGGGTSASPPPTTPPPPATAGCTLRERQDWVLAQMNEWYLFPESLATNVNPASFNNIDDYVDALVAPARALNKDRYFTYVTSIAAEDAFYQSGASAGFGFRLSYDLGARRVFVAESFEGTPALAAGIDRGTEIIAVGTSTGNLRTVDSIIASEGAVGVSDALGPSTVGTTRLLRVRALDGTSRDVSIAKTEFSITPVSSRYGARILDDGGKKVGYVNMRTFIDTADPALRSAFATFRAQGVTEVIVDLRYNGGGLVSIAETFNDLLLNKPASNVMGYITLRPSKASQNETVFFAPQPQGISSMKIAFIGTPSSASASELVMNASLPYLGANAALIGGNTYGKPVGQIAINRTQCDDRLRVVAFRTENSARQGDYYTGLASKFQSTCRATDDLTRPLGDPQESSIRVALDFLAGRACTPIAEGGGNGISGSGIGPQGAQTAFPMTTDADALRPSAPTPAQREVPGLF